MSIEYLVERRPNKRGSRLGLVCESRTESMQNIKYPELTGGRDS